LRLRLRVCVVLKHWISTQFHDFDSTLLEQLNQFVDQSLRKDGNEMEEMANRLRQELKKQDTEKKMSTVIDSLAPIKLQLPEGLTEYSPVVHFMKFDELEIARQLTLIESKMFAKISAPELLNNAWNRPSLQYKSPHVVALIERANSLSYWVASLILWHTSLATRVEVIEKFIKIGEHLLELRNFNALIAIIAGLNLSAISRLKFTWLQLPTQSKDILRKLQDLFDPGSAFKSYRRYQMEVSSKGPLLPYIGVSLVDLTFSDEGNPNYLNENPALINFEKRILIYRIIQDLLLVVQQPYSFPVTEPIYSFLFGLHHMTEKELYSLSLYREPKGASLFEVLRGKHGGPARSTM